MRDTNGKSYKAKGIKSSSLSHSDFINLLNNQDINTAVKRQSKAHWDLGYVVIEDKENIIINSNSYTKREKIFDKSNKWLDTRPIYENKIDYAVVVYKAVTRALTVYEKVNPYIFRGNIKMSKSTFSLKDLLLLLFLIIIAPVSVIAFLSTL